MITDIRTLSLYVADQDRAKDFFVNKMGFELRQDAPLYPGAKNRWVSVAPKGALTELILYVPDENWEHYKQVVGQSQSMTFNVVDMKSTIADLKAKGVEVVSEADPQPWGTNAIIRDSEGNSLILVELPKR